MFGLGFWELLIILAIILLLFGVKRLPQLGQSLGEGISNFTKSFQGDDTQEKKEKEQGDSLDDSSDGPSKPPAGDNS